jgi:hypothetical protein
MCDFIKKLFGGGDDNSAELLGLFRKTQQEQSRANDLAETAARDAKARAAAAMVSPADSEEARLASERRIRRLIQTRGSDEVTSLGAAPVSYRALMGS